MRRIFGVLFMVSTFAAAGCSGGGGGGNDAPTADAGADQTVDTGEMVALTGAGTDANTLDILSYEWSFETIPAGSQATMPGSSGISIVAPSDAADSAPKETIFQGCANRASRSGERRKPDATANPLSGPSAQTTSCRTLVSAIEGSKPCRAARALSSGRSARAIGDSRSFGTSHARRTGCPLGT